MIAESGSSLPLIRAGGIVKVDGHKDAMDGPSVVAVPATKEKDGI